jgi:hypothetical protein
MNQRLFLRVLSLAAIGCSGERAPAADTAAASVPPAAPTPPADSLVLEAPGGVTVWFTVAREAKDSSGATCLERALEIRRDTLRAGVPLLYTREAPTLLDSAHMRAVLYNGCRAGPAYRVDFATVSPRRITP